MLSDDMIGAEAGGAIKNVLAIACGIVEGRGLGRSAHAALITRGFAELTRLAVALGGEAETVAGLCGLGDLVLTCSSPQSRNMSVGLALGRGESSPGGPGRQAVGGRGRGLGTGGDARWPGGWAWRRRSATPWRPFWPARSGRRPGHRGAAGPAA